MQAASLSGELGDIIVLAVPYTAVDGILRKWGPKMKDKVLIDITNPVDFETMDHKLVPDGTSAAELIRKKHRAHLSSKHSTRISLIHWLPAR